MKFRFKLIGFVTFLTIFPISSQATNSVLSSVFDGSETKSTPLPGTCPLEENPLGYKLSGNFTVSSSGDYTVSDSYHSIGVDIVAYIYVNSWDPANPLNNLVTLDGVDIEQTVSLIAGTNYVLVIQLYCSSKRDRVWVSSQGAWAVTFSGPGEVTSANIVSVPEWTEGVFSGNDPTTVSECGNSQYQQTGPIRVPRTDTYYYTDVSINYAVDMCLQIYTVPFDPARPNDNRVEFMDGGGSVDDDGWVELKAATDYYFVTQPLLEAGEGEYFYLFAPQAPFNITYAISGSWYFPATSGQGFLIDVFDTQNLMFLAWFTYDLERPASDTPALIGDPGHRWMTGLGPIAGNTADLDITWSSGMIFDSESPPVSTQGDGTMTVEFNDCYTGNVSYDLGSSGRTGTVPIQRIVNDAVPLCETLTEGPAIPGPL